MDRRLGRPLPHQLPNPTRADPSPINLSQTISLWLGVSGITPGFPGLFRRERARSHALLTRPPLTPKGPLDLHVLSLPPAFVLSQDQTLKLKRLRRPFLTDEPLHIAPALTEPETKRHRSAVHRSQGTDVRQTVKLTPTSSGLPLRSRYADSPSIEMNQTARISLHQIIHVKERGQQEAASVFALTRPASSCPIFTAALRAGGPRPLR